MRNFEFANPTSVKEAISLLGTEPGKVKVMAGGSDLIGELKDGIEAPERIVNLRTIKDLNYIKFDQKSGLSIGAMATLNSIEENPQVQERYGALVEAVSVTASPALRNTGTIGGNLSQRPRCWYYRGPFHCYKKGGDFCFAVTGENKYMCIVGGELCYIVHPSDTAPALIALGAQAKIAGPGGEKTVPLEQFFVGPREDVLRENILKPNEILVEIQVPVPAGGTKGTYIKERERKSWDFAIVSAAAVIQSKDGTCKDARVVVGGIAPIPMRVGKVEDAIKGKKINAELATTASQLATQGARPMSLNEYKVKMAQAVVKRAILACV